MPDFLSFINEVLWGSIMIYLLLGAGIWFTLRSGFIQFRYIRKFGKSLKNSITPQPGGLTSFQALCTSLAARVGSGNLAGVALAISAGGPGAVFWMWVTAIIGMATSFAECSLAQLYKEKDKSGQFRGGPAWYMARGLGMRWMGVLFSVFLLIAYGLIFNTVQANCGPCATLRLPVPRMANRRDTGDFHFAGHRHRPEGCCASDAMAGADNGASVGSGKPVRDGHAHQHSAKSDYDYFPECLRLAGSGLWRSGLYHQPGTDGRFSARDVLERSRYGFNAECRRRRRVRPPHPAAQGIVQMIGVLTDTIIICSASAMIVLLSGPMLHTGTAGIQLVQQALVNLSGSWGAGFVSVIVTLFAFSSIVVNYLYAENNLIFLGHDSRRTCGCCVSVWC
jgi:AGCS family alanine or glycine:cation symporter